MSGIYEELLTATIRHLEDWKASGIKSVSISNATLAWLENVNVAGQAAKSAHRRLEVKPGHSSQPSQTSEQFQRNTSPTTASLDMPISPMAASGAPRRSPPEKSPPPVGALLSPEAKASAFAELRQRALACIKCSHLANSRQNVVFGVGDLNAQLMFVGEAPGADEDAQGEPFVGKAGQLLTRIIQTMGLAREKVYIANVLKCRPDTPGQTAGNRKPTPEEMKTCLPYLNAQIDLIQPKAIVALGATAVEGLLGRPVGITKLRGNWQEFRGIPVMPTYHPSYLLRNQALSVKREVWEDMLQVMEKLLVPISEKQRNYFLKA